MPVILEHGRLRKEDQLETDKTAYQDGFKSTRGGQTWWRTTLNSSPQEAEAGGALGVEVSLVYIVNSPPIKATK